MDWILSPFPLATARRQAVASTPPVETCGGARGGGGTNNLAGERGGVGEVYSGGGTAEVGVEIKKERQEQDCLSASAFEVQCFREMLPSTATLSAYRIVHLSMHS
ncbi:hypothetical protein [Oryza sativa Japonica Group]|uniref:Uncharacterized protein n=1 Tax=Oryza sativa subsp. japonica TaxID=39947 RepID=Q8W0F6_ORYSJ|nr:hypothetical protein [Oryza sativa Japonica Group]